MYGTLRGALAGRKIAFDRDSYTAAVEGRITGIGKTIRITAIHVHYNLAVPAEARRLKIEGSVRANLIAAIASARRWRGRPVHKDTLLYWDKVLDHARNSKGEPLGELVGELEAELAGRVN